MQRIPVKNEIELLIPEFLKFLIGDAQKTADSRIYGM